MNDPSVLLGEFLSLSTTPQAVSGGGNILLTAIHAANVSESTRYWLHVLDSDGTTRRWPMLVPAGDSGFIFTLASGILLIGGTKVAISTAKSSVTGSPGTDVDVLLFGRGHA